MSQRDDPRDDDIAARLDELAAILDDLREDLREGDRRAPPRPPRLTELLRFTEQYTIPTVIALLETTITSLELVRGALRLVDPEGRLDDERRRARDAGTSGTALDAVRDGATTGLARSLSELQRALEEANLPEETVSRTILEEARDLSAEIEAAIEGAESDADANRRPESPKSKTDRRESKSDRTSTETPDTVHIDVTGPGEDANDRESEDRAHETEGAANDESTESPGGTARPAVDVESELESIKRQVGDEGGDDPQDEGGDDQEAANQHDEEETVESRDDAGESDDVGRESDDVGDDGSSRDA